MRDEQLIGLLCQVPNAAETVANLVNLVRRDAGKPALLIKAEFNTGVSGTDLLADLFDYLERRGEKEKVLQLMRGHFADRPALASAIDGVLTNRAIPSWYRDRIVMEKAFIDRDVLRTKVYDLLECNAHQRSLLLVSAHQGGPGKSHTWWLLRHLADRLAIAPIHFDLRNYPAMQSLAEDIVDHLALEGFQQRFTTEVREARNFVGWISGKLRIARSGQQRYLIIFDHLDKEGIPSDVRVLVFELIKNAMQGTLAGVQLIVLDSPHGGFDRVVGRYDEEQVASLTRHEIENFIAWVRDVRSMAGDPDPRPPTALTTALQNMQFPLSKMNLQTIEELLTTWWATPHRQQDTSNILTQSPNSGGSQ